VAETRRHVGSIAQNSEFERLSHSVYEGRERLGCYERIAAKRYAARNATGRLLGKIRGLKAADSAVIRCVDGGARELAGSRMGYAPERGDVRSQAYLGCTGNIRKQRRHLLAITECALQRHQPVARCDPKKVRDANQSVSWGESVTSP
jgi:hypothetical protein